MVIELTSEDQFRLDVLAASTQRSKSEIAQEALHSYLSYMETLAAFLNEGEESAEQEGWLTQDEVFARLNARLPKPREGSLEPSSSF